MGRTYTLESPFFELEFDGKPDHWFVIVIAFMVVNLAVLSTALYFYAVVFAGWVGFETAVLVGVGLIALGMGSE